MEFCGRKPKLRGRANGRFVWVKDGMGHLEAPRRKEQPNLLKELGIGWDHPCATANISCPDLLPGYQVFAGGATVKVGLVWCPFAVEPDKILA
jgi:hypothetical protein